MKVIIFDNDYQDRIEKHKKKFMKRYAINEIDAYRWVCKKKFFKEIEREIDDEMEYYEENTEMQAI